MARLPSLPQLLNRKIYKTGQTRGADDDEIFQNRVGRNSTVLIPFSQFQTYSELISGGFMFENGFIVLLSPNDFFGESFEQTLEQYDLVLGENALVFYETRAQWINHNPDKEGWTAAQSRTAPLGGQYIARISATTSQTDGHKIVVGFNTTSSKGAGIRVYEYSSSENTQLCRVQLESLFWLCKDSEKVAQANGMSSDDSALRKQAILEQAEKLILLDKEKLLEARMVNAQGVTICPLCLEEVSAQGFFSKMEQALGREVHDLTITQLNLFHIEELKFGSFNHRPYNLGWGHHHCNVVVKDAGIHETLDWMREVIDKNDTHNLQQQAS